MNEIRVGIVGGTGYAGSELLRLLATHPHAKPVIVTSRTDSGQRVDKIFPNLRGRVELVFTDPAKARLETCDVVFFATPNGTAMQEAKRLLAEGVRIIDLAADFRLKDPSVWSRWYGMKHSCPELLDEAVYGLPEINRDAIRNARLVANPGCYPTAVILGFLPLIRAGALASELLIADTKSGVSGAGRKLSLNTLFSESAENFHAYGVQGHRHLPEIRQILNEQLDYPLQVVFVPHLLPMIRGIHATLYAETDLELDIQAVYEKAYHNEPFVDVMPAHSHPETRSVRGSNQCRIAVSRAPESRTVVILSVIDNLVKGAAGQAVQNMNLMFGFDEKTGLDIIPMSP